MLYGETCLSEIGPAVVVRQRYAAPSTVVSEMVNDASELNSGVVVVMWSSSFCLQVCLYPPGGRTGTLLLSCTCSRKRICTETRFGQQREYKPFSFCLLYNQSFGIATMVRGVLGVGVLGFVLLGLSAEVDPEALVWSNGHFSYLRHVPEKNNLHGIFF